MSWNANIDAILFRAVFGDKRLRADHHPDCDLNSRCQRCVGSNKAVTSNMGLGGDSQTSRREIQKAVKANPFVIECLVNGTESYQQPESFSPGSHEEAIACAEELRPAVVTTQGAMQWLEDQGHTEGRGRRNRIPKRRKQRSR